MIEILQQNGEVVCCIGSALNENNIAIFHQSNIGVAIEPTGVNCLLTETPEEKTFLSSSFLRSQNTTNSICSDIIALPCSVLMSKRSAFINVLTLIIEARRLTQNLNESIYFLFLAHLMLHLLIFISYLALLPTILLAVQLMWLCWIILPIFGIGLFTTPFDKNIMTKFSDKNVKPKQDTIERVATTILFRTVPTIFALLAIFVWTFIEIYDQSLGDLIGFSDDVKTVEYRESLYRAQNILLVALVYFLAFLSFYFVQGTEGLLKIRPSTHWRWFVCSLLCVTLQIFFCFLSVGFDQTVFTDVPYKIWILVILWPVVILIIDEYLKRQYKDWYKKHQLFLKLGFETRLGMYSPKSPYPEGDVRNEEVGWL
eukprot:TRINITY_DN4915_c0_g1_i1.p1 TRINITY_DN4915_c0_g1~~TRINITY_DN4915_c0_g1_i1.p1  ORF type:complete len:419 (-),score=104.43 TRINITY_DN4915_c0_g1_i1:9-1118(-)